jgi:uncharacterized Zn ribbon protein
MTMCHNCACHYEVKDLNLFFNCQRCVEIWGNEECAKKEVRE